MTAQIELQWFHNILNHTEYTAFVEIAKRE